MPWPGFEPGRLAALPPQDSVSTSFTTRAGPTKSKARNRSAARPAPVVLQQSLHGRRWECVRRKAAQRANRQAHLLEIHTAMRAGHEVRLEPRCLGGRQGALEVVSHELHEFQARHWLVVSHGDAA